jgi:hypothetical protein
VLTPGRTDESTRPSVSYLVTSMRGTSQIFPELAELDLSPVAARPDADQQWMPLALAKSGP